MRNIFKLFILGGFLFVSSCGLTDLEANLKDPNNLGVDDSDINLLMNQVQADFADFFSLSSETSMEVTRMFAMTAGDAYARTYTPQAHDDIWGKAYQDVLLPIEKIIPLGEKTGATVHVGAAKVLKAYTALTLVDLFGDVPFSKALAGESGAASFNPAPDKGADIYASAIATLDAAIADLAKTPKVALSRDVYYGGSAAKWTALANTLKLKAYMNLRLTDASAKGKIEALLKADIIDTDDEEFTYKYGTADLPARSRANYYRQFYLPVEGSAGGYIGNFYMSQLYKASGVEDPRWRYYFYRQVGSRAKALKDDPESVPCYLTPKVEHYLPEHPWCFGEPGFFGRDHGNNDGTPPDSRAITCVGVYPYGGLSDTNRDDVNFQKVTKLGQGANGAGIEPIWMSSFTDFVKAEAALVAGQDASAFVKSGVTKSIERTIKFGAAKGQAVPADLNAPTAAYVAGIEKAYAASTDKTDVAMREYYKALWGNGVEAYNMYRRTGKPARMQPMRAVAGGKFLRSFVYPSDYVNLNSSGTQKTCDATNQVFWDNNPDNFIN
jgi:hypothetical protein